MNQSKILNPNNQANRPNSNTQIGVNVQVVNQFNLKPQDLVEYNKVYPDAAKDIMQLIKCTVEHQANAEKKVLENNEIALKNQTIIIKTERHKLYLSFLLSTLALLVSIYLIQHPSPYLKCLGAALLIAVCLVAFEPRIIKFLIPFLSKKDKNL